MFDIPLVFFILLNTNYSMVIPLISILNGVFIFYFGYNIQIINNAMFLFVMDLLNITAFIGHNAYILSLAIWF